MAKRPSVTLTAEMPSGGSTVRRSGLTSRTPGVPATPVRVVPAGIEPSGSPLESSLTNSSPSPPSVALDAPATSPMRNSGSLPGVTGCGRAQVVPAAASRLASPRLAQRRVQLCDGEFDVGIGVRTGDEASLERRGGEEHAAGERGPVPAREQRHIGGFRLHEVPHGTGCEVEPPHRARVPARHDDPAPAGGVPYTRNQSRGSPLERLVETR